MLQAFDVNAVLHCGDIGSGSIVPLFASWPTHFVLGNVDRQLPEIERAVLAAGQTFHGRFGEIELVGVKIALLHGDEPSRFEQATTSGQWNLVCYGHTHTAEHHFEGHTMVLNPGALYRAARHTVAIVTLPSLEVTLAEV